MQNPITHLEWFVTPETPDDLAYMLNSIGSPDEVRIAWQAAAMATNLAYQMVQDMLKRAESEALADCRNFSPIVP